MIELARKAGAVIAKEPRKVFWGGYSGYFSDPDGYYWEVAQKQGKEGNKEQIKALRKPTRGTKEGCQTIMDFEKPPKA